MQLSSLLNKPLGPVLLLVIKLVNCKVYLYFPEIKDFSKPQNYLTIPS